MYTKLILAVLIASTAALGSNTTSAHANAITDCSFIFSSPCSDTFVLNGAVLGGNFESVLNEPASTLTLSISTPGQPLDTTVAVIFTEQGTGTGPTAPVSDFVVAFTANSLTATSDPFEGATVENVEALLSSGSLIFTKFTVVEETGDAQSLTAFNPDLTVQFASDVEATTPVPAALPLFATGLGAIGLLGWRRKRKARAVA